MRQTRKTQKPTENERRAGNAQDAPASEMTAQQRLDTIREIIDGVEPNEDAPAIPQRVVITVSGGCAEIVEQPEGVDVLVVDYDNLEASTLEDVDEDVLEWLKVNAPDQIPAPGPDESLPALS